MDAYTVLGRIGEGAHGIVMKAKHKPSGAIVALKKIMLKRLEDGIPVNNLREIKALQLLEHENIVHLFEVVPQGLGFVLVFEFMASDLSEMIQNVDEPLQRSQIKKYMQMLLRGTHYLHSNDIMHRDLKPANLLISMEGNLKIADFGLCCIFHRTERKPYSHQVATRWYRAPELLYGARYYREAVDLWSIGCIFGELLNFSPIFPGENDIDQLGIVIRTLGTPNEKIWPGVTDLPDFSKITFPSTPAIPLEVLIPEASIEAKELFKQFIVYEAEKRIACKEALNHPYFTEKPLPASMDKMPRPAPKKLNSREKEINGELKTFPEIFENLFSLQHQ